MTVAPVLERTKPQRREFANDDRATVQSAGNGRRGATNRRIKAVRYSVGDDAIYVIGQLPDYLSA